MNSTAYRRGAAVALLLALVLVLAPTPSFSADAPAIDPALLKGFSARCIGPATMGGRITDLAVVESKPSTFYVATASGGLWKTTNNGTTFKPVFEKEATVALGDVTVAPSDPSIVWVGTGESNARNSVSWGDGVYKSKDGGQSWEHMGLKDSHHIGRIAIHPKDPNIVYVAALGHFWGPNKERGLYKTADGGKTWLNTKFLGEDCGFVDLAMDPDEPDTLYAAAYAVRRDGFSGGNPARQFSEQAGIYKTTDGGKNWNKLTKGLPERPAGRIGLDIYRKNTKTVYAVFQTDRTNINTVAGQPARAAGPVETGGIFRSDDKGETWTKLNDLCPRPFYYGKIRIDPTDDNRIYVLGVQFFVSGDGGRSFRSDGASRVHSDHHALWIDPRDPEHIILGCDGGLYVTYDRTASWEFNNTMPIGQFYGVGVDMRKPYWVYGGLQDNGSWGGPSATTRSEGIANTDWRRILGGDGFMCACDPTDHRIVYAESQYGNLARIDLGGGVSRTIRPRPAQGQPAYRFNWNSPLLMSPHDPKTIYYGGNHVFRSKDRGDRWEKISPDLTRGAPGSLTMIAESPKKAGVVWAGSDDGKLHLTKDDGMTWIDLSEKVPNVPQARTISRVECSHFDEATAYLSIDRHRNDDQRPYLFKTTDYGDTWKPLMANLPPAGPVLVVREDRHNKDLLFAGTEYGLFISLDGGGSWNQFKNNFPTVPVHDLVIHPRDRDLVIGTHGRSIWVMDIAPLQQLTSEVAKNAAFLFEPKPAYLRSLRGPVGSQGAKAYYGQNPTPGATVSFFLKEKAEGAVKLVVVDSQGKDVIDLNGSADAGLHHVSWSLRRRPVGMLRTGLAVAPGEYLVNLTIGGKAVMTKKLVVEAESE